MSDPDSSSSPIVWAIVTIIVAMITAYGTIKSSQTNPPNPPNPPDIVEPPTKPSKDDLAKKHEGRLKNAIDLVSNVEARAVQELNENLLYKIYKGEALELRVSHIELLRNQGVFQVSNRKSISYGEITVDSNELNAKVRATPVWETRFHTISDGQCVGYIPPRSEPQTIELELTNGKWMVDSLVFDNNTSPQMLPCN